jgi:hypothetical protein
VILIHDGFKRITYEVEFVFNIDNLLYPDCLRKVDKRLGKEGNSNDVLIFRIVDHKRGPT